MFRKSPEADIAVITALGPGKGIAKKPVESEFDETTLAWINAIDTEIGHKHLSEIISKVTGMPKKDAYKHLLELKQS